MLDSLRSQVSSDEEVNFHGSAKPTGDSPPFA